MAQAATMFRTSFNLATSLSNRAASKRGAYAQQLVNRLRASHGFGVAARPYSTSPQAFADASYIEDNLKLEVKESEGTTYVDVHPVDSGKWKNALKSGDDHTKACVLCRLNLRNLDYTDVLILSQFIKRNGSLATYHESKLCSKQYRRVVDLIKKAQRCNLVQRPPDYLVPGAWHDLNTYLERDRKRDQPMKVIKKEYWKM